MIYEVKVQYANEDKLVKEQNVVEGYDLFAEVEARLYSIYNGFKDLEVTAVKRSKIREIANKRESPDDLIWVAELMDVYTNDEGEETEIKYKILLFAKTFDGAKAFITEYMKQGYQMQLVSLKLTNFIEVYQ